MSTEGGNPMARHEAGGQLTTTDDVEIANQRFPSRNLNNARVPPDFDLQDQQSDSLGASFQAGQLFLRRNWILLMIGAFLGVMLAPLAFVLAPGHYTASTTLLFDTDEVRLFQGPTVVNTKNMLSYTRIQSQIRIMKSSPVLERVIRKLKLDTKPGYAKPRLGRIQRWFGDDAAKFLGRYRKNTPAALKAQQISMLRAGLTIFHIPQTYAVTIRSQSSDPEEAARIANAVASAYLEKRTDDKTELSSKAGGWLYSRLEKLRKKLSDAQRNVTTFRKKHGLVDTDGKRTLENSITTLNRELMSTRARLGETKARLKRIKSVIASYNEASVKPVIPDILSNPLATKLREKYFELRNREREWAVRFGTTHKATAKLRKEMRTIEGALLEEYRRLAESYLSDIAIAEQRVASITKDISSSGSKLRKAQSKNIVLRQLESRVQTYQRLYDGFLAKFSEASNQNNLPTPKVQILEPAATPMAKQFRRTMKMALLLAMFGFGLGAGAAVLREVTDRSFRRIDEVEQVLSHALISIMPVITRDELKSDYFHLKKNESAPDERIISQSINPIWAAEISPQSRYAAAARAIRHNIDQSIREAGCYVVAVTSAQPNEGASTVAAAIAVTSASTKSRVLLMDCDLRNPSLTRLLAPKAKKGLVDILLDDATLQDTIWTEPQSNLHFMPIASNWGVRPDELLGSPTMSKLIEELKEHYDYIVIDLPPLVPMVDVQMASSFVSGFVGVVKWGYSQKEATRRAFERVPNFENKVLGLVLNHVDLHKLRLYDAEAAQWFDRKRYSDYYVGNGVTL